MIIIVLGLPGSGKTASIVREILTTPYTQYYSNIATKNVKNNTTITPEMIVTQKVVGEKTKRDGTVVPITEKTLNVDYWKSKEGAINVILDEAHTVINSRRAMSKTNILLTDWLALIRRVLGQSDVGEGNLYLITQLWHRLDKVARDMATQVRYHRSHFLKTCKKCKYTWQETNDNPNQLILCPSCHHHRLEKHSLKIEVMYFANMKEFELFDMGVSVKPYKHFFINDIEKVFKHYNTLQWENLLSELY